MHYHVKHLLHHSLLSRKEEGPSKWRYFLSKVLFPISLSLSFSLMLSLSLVNLQSIRSQVSFHLNMILLHSLSESDRILHRAIGVLSSSEGHILPIRQLRIAMGFAPKRTAAWESEFIRRGVIRSGTLIERSFQGEKMMLMR